MKIVVYCVLYRITYIVRSNWASLRNRTFAVTDIYRTPEQKARDKIDAMLNQAGWKVQSKDMLDFSANLGIAVREYQTDVGPTDYVLFVESKPSALSRPSRRNGVTISRPLNRSPALMPLPNSSRSTIKNPCRSYTNLPWAYAVYRRTRPETPLAGNIQFPSGRKPYRNGTQMTIRFPLRLRPSPILRWVGPRIARFEACSTFTRVPARMFAELLSAALLTPGGFRPYRYLHDPPWLLPTGATVIGRVSHPLEEGAFPQRTVIMRA